MRLTIALLAATAAFAATTAEAATVEIKDAVARVTVVPEDRKDIKVEVIRPNSQLPLSVRTLGDRTIVDGDLDRRIRNCRSDGEGSWVEVRGVGKIGWAEMPQVVIRTPRDVKVDAGGAVFGSVGRSNSLDLRARVAGSGDIHAGEVRGQVSKTILGSGSVRVGG